MQKESQFNKVPRDVVNPYFNAILIIYKRLKWDLNFKSWNSRKKINKLKNIHKGKKAVIICNGPSLKNVDFDKLMDSGVYYFGLNKINLMFDDTKFRPNAIVASNKLVIEQNKTFYNNTDIQLFLNSEKCSLISNRENVVFVNYSSIPRKFAKDCSVSLFQGHTVTYTAMQLAYHMGFAEVALIGCDHHFETSGPSNKTVVAGDVDPNHFHPKYFSDGDKWELPDLLGSEYHYDLADRMFKHDGRRIVNCTTGGKLEIFDRVKLEDFLN
ncbi:6-hydroxymethylpterin diphosphokinase MptE-like protein [Polaribacter staleyi]|uniref:6-hydroxymethylpterin diphosphokinase MptE-like protein n=1 Tax=Polaribacter staleyi TaxID=2022337 RepID=UPI0031B9CC69